MNLFAALERGHGATGSFGSRRCVPCRPPWPDVSTRALERTALKTQDTDSWQSQTIRSLSKTHVHVQRSCNYAT